MTTPNPEELVLGRTAWVPWHNPKAKDDLAPDPANLVGVVSVVFDGCRVFVATASRSQRDDAASELFSKGGVLVLDWYRADQTFEPVERFVTAPLDQVGPPEPRVEAGTTTYVLTFYKHDPAAPHRGFVPVTGDGP